MKITFLFIISLNLNIIYPQICFAQKMSKKFVDKQTPKNAAPFINNDSVSKESLKKNWKLEFSDEFNDYKIDTSKWTVEQSTKKRVDITLFSDDNQVEEKDGNINIYYHKAPDKSDTAFYAGRFNSKNKYKTTYGFLEARIHLVKPNGYQTAFWMMPNSGVSMSNTGPHDGTAGDGAEIDIVEGNRLKTYSLGLHWDGYAKGVHKGAGSGRTKISNLHDVEYHVFGLEWTPTYLRFYCDGKVVKEINDPKAIPHVDEYIIFSGSCWGFSDWVDGDIRKNEFIQNGGAEKGYIDYVRVYKAKL
jgi:beta-glucanase (GH16 family)